MSRIDFRLGNLTGRLAGMVGASWKGIDYIRKMVIPANPNTSAQQGVRTTFASLVAFGRRINSTILKTGILPKPKKMSQFNKFIQNNQAQIEAGAFAFADLLISVGSLFIAAIQSAAGSESLDTVTISWLDVLEGEAQLSDPVFIVVYNETLDLYGFDTSKTRADDATTVDIQVDPGDVIHVYMFMTQGTTLATETKYMIVTVT